MPDILLATLNAKFIHASFGLRCLLANMGDLMPTTELCEFDINQRSLDIAESILAKHPKIIGFGVYIWNVVETRSVLSIIKRIRPDLIIILGGPEVSYESIGQPILELCDHVLTGEADVAFYRLCHDLLAFIPGSHEIPKIIHSPLPDLNALKSPYPYYSDSDIKNRLIYVEASRGCPFTCEFCLSSLDIPVRQFPLKQFLADLTQLFDSGARHFKFVDRTFNLHLPTSTEILSFCLERAHQGLFSHFEMVPDRLPEALRTIISKFPPGSLQFEIGVQTFDPEVSENISRRQNLARLEENFRFLRSNTSVHIHADLIAGLPGETMESFACGFDRLFKLHPQEIQVGILKRLKGTPISRHEVAYTLIYADEPPFEILSTSTMNFESLQRLRRFARYWDLVGNSGNFTQSTASIANANESPFYSFQKFADWLYAKTKRTHGIALNTLSELIFRYLTEQLLLPMAEAANVLWQDYQASQRSEIPPFLRPWLAPQKSFVKKTSRSVRFSERQDRRVT